MILPPKISEKVEELYLNLKTNNLKKTRENLTNKYKTKTGNSVDLVSSKDESIVYAISRMPATYSVLYSLFSDLIEQELICDVNSIFDVGSGTGAGYFAIRELFDLDISLFEKNKQMIDTFSFLSNDEVKVNKFDLIKDNFDSSADLIVSSYVLSELSETDRENAFKKLLTASNKYVLIVDTGTPDTFKNMMKLKNIASEAGFNTIAPCKCKVCPLENDYCQFFARVERTSILRQLKQGTLPYEDEKYFYLLFSRENKNIDGNRVIRRPKISTNLIELTLCTGDGVVKTNVTKKNKDEFKRAKKTKINEIF